MSTLEGKKILFLGIGFYDYEELIINELENRGANVTYHSITPTKGYYKIVHYFYQKTRRSFSEFYKRYQQYTFIDCEETKFDIVFVIKGENLDLGVLKRLRQKCDNSDFILYQWDSLNRVKNAEKILPYFDRVYSFDPIDCEEHTDFIFRPLFHREIKEFEHPSSYNYDLSFIGWLHDERKHKLEALYNLIENKSKLFGFLYTGFFTWFKLNLRKKGQFLSYIPMPYSELQTIVRQSKALIDFPHHKQAGLTMRAIESLGMGRKLITTSENIIKYDFYHEDNVFVIPQGAGFVRELTEFLDRPYIQLSREIYEKYTLSRWVDDVFKER